MSPHSQTRLLPDPAATDSRPLVTRMAEAMRDQNAEAGGCTAQSLLDAGFTLAEITQHGPAARRRAEALFMGTPEPMIDDAVATEAAIRVAIGELFPARRLIENYLAYQGFSPAQIAAHLPASYRLALKDAQGAVPSHTGALVPS